MTAPARFRLFLAPSQGRWPASNAWRLTGGPFYAGLAGSSVDIHQVIESTLKADPRLNTVIAQRVFPAVIPESQPMPALVTVFRRIRRQHDLDGPTGVAFADVTFYAVSKNFGDCRRIAEALRQLFDGFTGTLTAPAGPIRVMETLAGPVTDAWTAPADSTDRGTFETACPYTFMYSEPLPARLS